mgnify:CR=1 FL=1
MMNHFAFKFYDYASSLEMNGFLLTQWHKLCCTEITNEFICSYDWTLEMNGPLLTQ